MAGKLVAIYSPQGAINDRKPHVFAGYAPNPSIAAQITRALNTWFGDTRWTSKQTNFPAPKNWDSTKWTPLYIQVTAPNSSLSKRFYLGHYGDLAYAMSKPIESFFRGHIQLPSMEMSHYSKGPVTQEPPPKVRLAYYD